MNEHKLDKNGMETIAHFITQRRITGTSDVAPLQINKAINTYLEIYNEILSELEKYNNSIN